jgi:glycosyltransferase involved in cell wall biosynthesis
MSATTAAAERARARERLLVVLSPYGVAPPRHGPAIRIAGILANLGSHWRVEHFSQSIQRTDLPWPRLTIQAGPRWTEHRLRDPLSWAWVIGLGMLAHYPAAYADRVLGLLPRRRIRATLSQADAVLVTPHNQFGWVYAHTPRATGIVVDVHCIEAELWPPRRARWTHRVAAELRDSERRAFAGADACIVTCVSDAQTVRSFGARAVALVPNGVDVGHFRPVASTEERRQLRRQIGEEEEGPMAVFVGSAGIANQSAVPVIVRQAAEYARAGIRIVVAGRIGAGRAPVPNVRWVGEVDDVSVWLRAADLAICPVLEGSGTSLKSVEYLAAGLPIVSTPIGMRGLGVSSGVHAVICDVDEMPRAAAELVADPRRMQALGESARRLAVDAFSWQDAGRAATEVFDRLAERRDATLAGEDQGRRSALSSS